MALPQRVYSMLSAAILALSVTLFISARGIQPIDLECVRSMSSWSPAWEAVDHQWETFQNTFSEKSKYRGQPTHELEEAWNAIIFEDPFVIPASRIELVSQKGDDFVKNVNGGIVAHFEYTYGEAYDYLDLTAFRGSEGDIMTFIDGCESLDLNILHYCRNFEHVQDWVSQHLISSRSVDGGVATT
ncbi:hypothetical protein GGR55DRAFT_690044 [Xylaria sp. FL0064]|nr:hypothetical protein GGR55DRAFT_690044 [Xylaria sp. FL0064]